MTSAQDQLVEGQATYGMANLRPDRTGLPFIVSSRNATTPATPRA